MWDFYNTYNVTMITNVYNGLINILIRNLIQKIFINSIQSFFKKHIHLTI